MVWMLRARLGLFFFLAMVLATKACGGIGPENLIVVVNADSDASRTIANHYVEFRQIPTQNVIFLKGVPKQPVTSLEAFREKILKPLLAELDSRGLAPQTRAIAYSAGFPYAVNINEHRERLKDPGLKKIFTPVASLNGLTFFYRFVLADNESYLRPEANLYARMLWDRHFVNPFAGESAASFDAAKTADSEGRHEDAAKVFLELMNKYPMQPPLGILAARSWVQAGKLDEAVEAIDAAILRGWSSGLALAEDPRLAPLKEREDFKKLVVKAGDRPTRFQHAIAFDASRGWTRNGWWIPPDQGGITYLPSFLLAVTEGQGTTVGEAVEYLRRASKADNTFPKGTFYITLTGDIRTKSRTKQFAETLLHLRILGQKAVIEKSVLPEKKSDVLGVTVGTPSFDWPRSGSQFLPGALADNLTSTGGVMHATGQTKLTEFLRAGAAAASGTVTEPYVVNESPWQFKFPIPQLHAYYAEGFSAIEAFYLACSSPYQLLLVGDPLCQPFAQPPFETVTTKTGIVEGQNAILIEPAIPSVVSPQSPPHTRLEQVEFYIDGKLLQKAPVLDQYRLQIGEIPGGQYEWRVVLVGDSTVGPRKMIRTWIKAPGVLAAPELRVISNDGLEAPGEPSGDSTEGSLFEALFSGVWLDDPPKERQVVFEINAPGADQLSLDYFGETLATLEGDGGRIALDLARFGNGPLRVRPFAEYRGVKVPGKTLIVPAKPFP